MSDLNYSIQEWKDAYEQAEIDGFADSSELHDWPLSQFMCGLVDSDEKVKAEPEILLGVINALDSEGFDGFSPEFMVTVLGTTKGSTEDNFQALSEQYIKDTYCGPDSALESIMDLDGEDDWEMWYIDNVLGSSEVYGVVESSGKLFWFDRFGTW